MSLFSRSILFWVANYCLLVPSLAVGHVGSPNVFFEGQAGLHPVRVIIRPPAVLPGAAQVDVRDESGGITNVLVQASLIETGRQAAPAPMIAGRVLGERNLFNTSIWLLRNGSYSVDITVEGARGRGTVSVPLSSAAIRQPAMSATVASGLLCLGLFLFVGAVWLAGAAARDAGLDSGVQPAVRDHARGRAVTVGTIVLLSGALYGGNARWRKMDQEFRNNALYKPLPVLATVGTNDNLRFLHLASPTDNPGDPLWDTLLADHGKLMHLFLIREPDFDTFAHLHPVRRDGRTFENVLPPLPAGNYQLYAEITYENGLNQTLTAKVPLPSSSGRAPQRLQGTNMPNEVFCQSAPQPIGNAAQPFVLDADDSWHLNGPRTEPALARKKFCPLMGGANMVFQNNDGLLENKETSLRFAVFNPEGGIAKLQPYMGMMGHAVVRRSDGSVFTHLHPLGTISMAAQEAFTRLRSNEGGPDNNPRQTNQTLGAIQGARASSRAEVENEVSFLYAFPRAGEYRVWVQVRVSGRVLTGEFIIAVKPAG